MYEGIIKYRFYINIRVEMNWVLNNLLEEHGNCITYDNFEINSASTLIALSIKF